MTLGPPVRGREHLIVRRWDSWEHPSTPNSKNPPSLFVLAYSDLERWVTPLWNCKVTLEESLGKIGGFLWRSRSVNNPDGVFGIPSFQALQKKKYIRMDLSLTVHWSQWAWEGETLLRSTLWSQNGRNSSLCLLAWYKTGKGTQNSSVTLAIKWRHCT